jgi:hypothetical protein
MQVWCDEQKSRMADPKFLCIWRPVAPAGYVALGMVVGLGALPPPAVIMRCIRADAALSTSLQRGAPTWVNPEFRQRSPVYGWTTDERSNCFIAMSQVLALLSRVDHALLSKPKLWYPPCFNVNFHVD